MQGNFPAFHAPYLSGYRAGIVNAGLNDSL